MCVASGVINNKKSISEKDEKTLVERQEDELILTDELEPSVVGAEVEIVNEDGVKVWMNMI